VVVLVQDTTVLHDGTTPPKPGMGTVKVKVREEPLRHPTVGLTPARMNLGGLGLKMWQRPEPPVAPERHRQPLEANERSRGLEGDQLACEVQQGCPETRVVHVADREGDLHEWFREARRRVPEDRAACSSRAQCHRRLAPAPAPCDGWEDRQQAV
jgi:hypothetical protein